VDESPLTPKADPANVPALISDSLRRYSQATDGDLCVGWLLISEWVAPNGSRYLRFTIDDNVMYWDVFGYLKMANMHFEALDGDD